MQYVVCLVRGFTHVSIGCKQIPRKPLILPGQTVAYVLIQNISSSEIIILWKSKIDHNTVFFIKVDFP